MDQSKRTELIATIKSQPDSVEGPWPVVSLEEFFVGNDDEGSIGCNLLEHPGVDAFYGHLRGIRARSDVHDVLVEIYEVEESDPSMWPFSERIYILTDADPIVVAEWLVPLEPDEVEEGWFQGKPDRVTSLGPNVRVVAVWWD